MKSGRCLPLNNYRLTPLKNTTKNKARIMSNVLQQIDEPVIEKKSKWMPIAASLLLFMVIVVASLPTIQEAFPNGAVTIEQVDIPDVEYAGLIMSTYLEETNEIILQQQNAIIAYNVNEKSKEMLVEVGEANIFESVVNEKWIVWEQFIGNEKSKMFAKNRETGDVKEIQIHAVGDVHIDGDILIVQSFLLREKDFYDIGYVRYNLLSDEYIPIQIFSEDYTSGQGTYGNGTLVVTEQLKHETQFQVYNTETLQNTANFLLRVTEVKRMQIQGDELFILYDDYEGTKLGVLNIETKQFEFEQLQIDASVTDYATDGKMFAIQTTNGEEDDEDNVSMFTREGNELKLYSSLSQIEERIVRPKLEGNTFVVYGDKEHQIYFLTME